MGRLNTPRLIVGDADALIAISHGTDSHHERACKLVEKSHGRGDHIIFPTTAISEAITALQRKLVNPTAANYVVQLVRQREISIVAVDEEIVQIATQFLNLSASKKHTFFDAIICAVAKREQADAIFSFDNWYKSQGCTLLAL